MSEVRVYGASDDLIEVDGCFYDEFTAQDFGDSDTGGLLAFSDGTVLRIEYSSGGYWRIHRIKEGDAAFEKSEATSDEGKRPDGLPAYSDVVKLTGEFDWCLFGTYLAKVEFTG